MSNAALAWRWGEWPFGLGVYLGDWEGSLLSNGALACRWEESSLWEGLGLSLGEGLGRWVRPSIPNRLLPWGGRSLP